jgi:uncharacterized protein (UPF0332 family)
MGKDLTKAFEKRQLADYEYTSVMSEEDAKDLLEKGKKFIENIVEYLKKSKILKEER